MEHFSIAERSGREKKRRLWGWAITAGSAAAIAWLTLLAGTAEAGAAVTGSLLLTDAVLNILLFIPFGVGLSLLGAAPARATIAGGLASSAIELTQMFFIPGRDATPRDVAANTIGVAIGALLVFAWEDRRRWWRFIGPSISVAVIVAWSSGAALMSPAFPRGKTWYGQWAHDFRSTRQFTGAVLAFSLNDVPIPDGQLPRTDQLRAEIARAGTTRAAIRLITEAASGGRAQLVGVVSPPGDELINLWQEGRSIVLRQRLHASDVRVRAVGFRAENLLPATAGDTVALAVAVTRSAMSVELTGSSTPQYRTFYFSPELFWVGFLPFEYAIGAAVDWWPLIAVALLFGALGLGLSRNPLVGLTFTVTALVLIPIALGTALPGQGAMIAALAAGIGGILLGRRLGL